MAPAVWNEEEFVSGGLKGITKFRGQLIEIEEDIEGKYGDQLALYFDECVVLESEDDVSLEDGKYTDWIKQTNKKNSVNQAFVRELRSFITAHKLKGGTPDALYGQDIIWERQEVTEASEDGKMSAGLCLVPIAMGEDEAPAKASRARRAPAQEEEAAPPARARRTRSKAAAEEPPEEPEETPAVDPALVTFITDLVGEDGVTEAIIRRDVTKKQSMNKLSKAAGGLAVVMAHLVEADILTEDDGTYFLPEED